MLMSGETRCEKACSSCKASRPSPRGAASSAKSMSTELSSDAIPSGLLNDEQKADTPSRTSSGGSVLSLSAPTRATASRAASNDCRTASCEVKLRPLPMGARSAQMKSSSVVGSSGNPSLTSSATGSAATPSSEVDEGAPTMASFRRLSTYTLISCSNISPRGVDGDKRSFISSSFPVFAGLPSHAKKCSEGQTGLSTTTYCGVQSVPV
mmetsp:Transcript_5319/g.18493  ORF Transcript_5319/g.18493 Transcript_5319/m.18493 type:complete len:209 (+) Transcript_5319:811-1437(+)